MLSGVLAIFAFEPATFEVYLYRLKLCVCVLTDLIE